jgi:hypothetical protein
MNVLSAQNVSLILGKKSGSMSTLAPHTTNQTLSSLEDYRHRRIERLKFVCVNCDAEQMKSLAMLEESPVCFSCAQK